MTPEELRFLVAVSWCAIGFAAYYVLSINSGFAGRAGSISRRFDKQGNHVILQRILGLVFLGVMSVLVISILPEVMPTDYGLGFAFQKAPPWWSLLLLPAILVIGFFSARMKGILKLYPQIRANSWTPAMVVLNGLSWIIFLVGYEFLFRGFLLQASLDIMATAPAIALNCALYAGAHFYKGPGETIGAIPAGILFCYLTVLTGNIWCAVILHSVMAISIECFSIRFHPKMEIIKAR